MDNNNNYIAITIGPINDTMNLVTKPGALWLSSYAFSYISKSLCIIIAEKIGCESIVTPYIPEKGSKEYDELICRTDGVGLFHDHIICKYNDEIWNGFAEIKNCVITDLAKKINCDRDELAKKTNCDRDELAKYIMISACKVTVEKGSSTIKACGPCLDAMELPKVFAPKERENPFIGCLKNKEEIAVARALGIDTDSWGLVRKVTTNENKEITAFKDLKGIASNSKTKDFKKNNYFCILRADGDNMSKIINALPDDEASRIFSKTCLDYCNAVADDVKSYGGITIYAGGDDLFALVPCETENGTVCTLIQTVIKTFERVFKNYIDKIKEENKNKDDNDKTPVPSLSFGLLICHRKHPLYEAVATSGDLLYNIAKNKNGEKKDCTVIQLQKHSGQTECFLVRNSVLGEVDDMLRSITSNTGTSSEDADEYLLSAAHKLLLFQPVVDRLTSDEQTKNAFVNIFDASPHIEVYESFLHKTLPEFYINNCLSNNIILLEKGKELPVKKTKTLAQVLRFMKFFVEKGED